MMGILTRFEFWTRYVPNLVKVIINSTASLGSENGDNSISSCRKMLWVLTIFLAVGGNIYPVVYRAVSGSHTNRRMFDHQPATWSVPQTAVVLPLTCPVISCCTSGYYIFAIFVYLADTFRFFPWRYLTQSFQWFQRNRAGRGQEFTASSTSHRIL